MVHKVCSLLWEFFLMMTLFHLQCYSDFSSKNQKTLIENMIFEFLVDLSLLEMNKTVDFSNILQQSMKKI